MTEIKGKIIRISGPVIEANDMRGSKMYDVVRVGTEHLIGEIIRLNEDVATIQVYEDTNGLKPGEIVLSTQEPLSVELGPGLISNIYDGIQRPLPAIYKQTGDFIARGVETSPLDRKKQWQFRPRVKKGDRVKGGDVLGEVQESSLIIHRILVSPDVEGTLQSISPEGKYTIDDPIAHVETSNGPLPLTMTQRWPVRRARRLPKNSIQPSR